MNGTLIASSPRSSVQPLAVQGIPVPSCHAQIVDILRSRLGEAHVLLFAEPVSDDSRAVTDWYTPVQGTPVPLSSLDPERQNRVRTRFASMAEEIRALIPPLSASGDRHRTLSGEILELALRYPGPDALYLVGEQPVVTCWGCGPAQAGVEAQDLTRLGPALMPVTPPPPPPLAPAESTPGQPFNWGRLVPWLLALLLLLLLAGLFYGWHNGCLGNLLLKWGWLDSPTPVSTLDEELDEAKSRRDVLTSELETLRLQLAERKSQCQPEALAVPEDAKADDLTFLEGEWVCDTGLSDSNNAPVVVVYAFDSKGKGAVTIESSHGVCTAQAATTLDADRKLRILTDPEILCPGGVSYTGQEVVCTGSGGQTRCQGRNTPGNTSWEANFYRRQARP